MKVVGIVPASFSFELLANLRSVQFWYFGTLIPEVMGSAVLVFWYFGFRGHGVADLVLWYFRPSGVQFWYFGTLVPEVMGSADLVLWYFRPSGLQLLYFGTLLGSLSQTKAQELPNCTNPMA